MSAELIDHNALINDPIATMVDETRRLRTAEDGDFARYWLLRALQAELHRYTMEDSIVDRHGEIFKHAADALAVLHDSSDWIGPKLQEYLLAVRRAAQLPQLAYEVKSRDVGTGDNAVSFLEREACAPNSFWVSNTTATHVSILDESLGSPVQCESVSSAFSKRLNELKAHLGITRLCFIEKEMGPVGAISMLSSLVAATGLPACIYRETHWTPDTALAASRPQSTDRMAIVYDLVVTGKGITDAADTVREMCGATTIAAMVLCGYGARRTHLESQAGQHITLEALDWRTNVHGPAFEYSPSRGEHETRKLGSESRAEPGGRAMDEEKRDQHIQPGSYSRQTLPVISASARQIVDRIRASVRSHSNKQPAAKSGSIGLLNLVDGGGTAIEIETPSKSTGSNS